MAVRCASIGEATAPRRAALTRLLARALVASAFAARASAVPARSAFPGRPISLLVPFAQGGIADLTARAVTRAMGDSLGQPVIVENRPGAGGVAAGSAVARAAPDGHTLLMVSNATAISAGLFRKLPFDPLRDFAPITALGAFDLAVMVAAGSPWRNLPELFQAARWRPGKLNLGTIAIGSTQHLSAEWLRARAGIDVALVPYKGTPALLLALRAGEVDAIVEILGPALPLLRAGELRALAVTGERRNPALPEVRTALEQGVRDFAVSSWNALAAPRETPPAVIERLRAAAETALATQAVQELFTQQGIRAIPGTPAQLAALLGDEITRWSRVIRDAGIAQQ